MRGESKAANASLTLQLFPRPACADFTQKHSSREADFSLFLFLPIFRSGGWMLVFGHGKEIPTCGSRGFSAVVGHVTISSVPVTSFWMLNEPPCLSSQFHLLALPGVVMWGWWGDGKAAAAPPWSSCGRVHLLGDIWSPSEPEHLQSCFLFSSCCGCGCWLRCAFWGHIICYIDKLATWGQSSCSELCARITAPVWVQKDHLEMKVGQAAHKSHQLLSAISFLSLAIDFLFLLDFSSLLLKRDFSMKDAEDKKIKYSPSALLTRTIAIPGENCALSQGVFTAPREETHAVPFCPCQGVPLQSHFWGAQDVKNTLCQWGEQKGEAALSASPLRAVGAAVLQEKHLSFTAASCLWKQINRNYVALSLRLVYDQLRLFFLSQERGLPLCHWCGVEWDLCSEVCSVWAMRGQTGSNHGTKKNTNVWVYGCYLTLLLCTSHEHCTTSTSQHECGISEPSWTVQVLNCH